MLKKIIVECILPILYKICSLAKLKNNVLFIEVRNDNISDNFSGLINYIKSQKKKNKLDVRVEIYHLRLGKSSQFKYLINCIRLMPKLAVSKYVFVNDCSNILAALKIRKGTKLIQVWHGCGALKKFGYSTDIQGKYYGNEDIVTVSTDETVVVDAFAEAMGVDKKRVCPIGVPRTDIYFREAYAEKCRELRNDILRGSNKKIILFAPTYRGKVGSAERPQGLNLDLMYKHLGSDYIVITKLHNALKKERPLCRHKGFFYDLSDELSIAEAMGVCDILITDYSSLIFEYSLLSKPAIFYAYDLDEYTRERGFYINYKEEMPGTICNSTMEIISEIKNGAFDVTRMKAFRNKYMRSCDGHSTRRLLKLVFDESSVNINE